jgi:hypothetical protein
MPLLCYGFSCRQKKSRRKSFYKVSGIGVTGIKPAGRSVAFFAENILSEMRKNSNITMPYRMKNNVISLVCFFLYMYPFLTP